ncbi:lysophospholipid acyltransferase family protein [Pseudonocardia pini]|uniref:lysophospholipid acyltransferase family protein n=1 Tax=Pseudonocardia pini TaxID=2758030 RepID=UPI0028AE0222|nr:lysophospholipid acyltransferase family protein [Pseudonocardia pini]
MTTPDPVQPPAAPLSPDLPPALSARQKVLLTLRRRRRTSGFWFGLAIEVIWPFVMVFTRTGWRGGEHIPPTGGVLIAANHVSSSDPVFDTAFVVAHRRMPRYLAKSELWSVPIVRSVLGRGGHIPVYRDSMRAMDAFKEAVAALERGEVVVFYPEATYTADPAGWPMKAKNGIGRIAIQSGVPVIPLANWGSQDVLPPSGRPKAFQRVSLVAGPPVDLTEFVGKPRTKSNLDAATAAIMGAVTGLVADVRGETPPEKPYDPAQKPALPEGPPEPLAG